MCVNCPEETKQRQREIREQLGIPEGQTHRVEGCKDCEKKHMSNFGKARVMSNGDIVYAKKGDEPPPDIEGYQRDEHDWWKFHKMWLPCCHRIQTPLIKPCGAYSVKTLCNHPDLPHVDVTFPQCQGCSFRKEPK
jgi:hypothetical protein